MAEVKLRILHNTPNIVYFSSLSENTKRFVSKLGMPAVRIPMNPKREGMIRVDNPYVLIVPTYGGGYNERAVPQAVIEFLQDKQNRSLLRGVISSGNTNFGEYFCLAGKVISKKCKVPELYRFELIGTPHDVLKVRQGLSAFWKHIDKDNK